VTLAEVAMGGPYQTAGVGLDLDLTGYAVALTAEELLFSESQGRAVVTCAPERAAGIRALAAELGVPAFDAGIVGPEDGTFRVRMRDTVVEHPVAILRQIYLSASPRRMGD
jgi:phosphoribosylformylglycinamidine (FGAM) synthase-like enzyme